MLRTDAKWRNGGRWLSLALLGGLAVNAAPVEAAGHTSPVQSWISLTSGQLCRTWSAPNSAVRELYASIPLKVAGALSANTLSLNAASQRSQNAKGLAPSLNSYSVVGLSSVAVTHCASQWHIATDGGLISDAPTWVPNPTGAWPDASDTDAATLALLSKLYATAHRANATANLHTAIHTSNKVASSKPRPRPQPSPNPGPVSPPPGGIGPWVPVPGHPSYGFHDFSGDPYSWMYGECTWWAWYMRRDEPQLGRLGMASNWIANARALGMRTGYTPVAGATVVFQPYVQGAGSGGHAAHVQQVLGGGWFIISEMNFYWNGGGWGRVDWRYVHTGPGVAFIY
ncbi:MAG TPA: CHAP domain-containing protein [Ktedonobacterales bacterium]